METPILIPLGHLRAIFIGSPCQDVRLRATFAATDSGGIQGSRLAVLEAWLRSSAWGGHPWAMGDLGGSRVMGYPP